MAKNFSSFRRLPSKSWLWGEPDGRQVEMGTPHALFEATTVGSAAGPYAVSADGKKFVMNTLLPQSLTEPLTLITNWPVELKQ